MLDVDAELAQQEAALTGMDDDDGSPRERLPREREEAAGASAGGDDGVAQGMERELVPVGGRKIIRRTLEPDGTLAASGIDPLDPEELKRRDARVEKFGLTAEQLVSKKREERMKKFWLDAPEPEAPTPPPVPVALVGNLVSKEELAKLDARARKFELPQSDPLALVEARAGRHGYWEQRRNALPSETPRLESVYVFGVDQLGTNELLLLFRGHEPQWVEWVNDSSANVVFASHAQALAALEGASEPLWAPTVDAALMDDRADGPDGGARAPAAVRAMQSWRTLPEAQAHAGKGLQLLLRLSSEQDLKPGVRRPSRWYGETERKGPRRAPAAHGRGQGRGGSHASPQPRPGPQGLAVTLGDSAPPGADGGGADLRAVLGKRTRAEPEPAAAAAAAAAGAGEADSAAAGADASMPPGHGEGGGGAAAALATEEAGEGAGAPLQPPAKSQRRDAALASQRREAALAAGAAKRQATQAAADGEGAVSVLKRLGERKVAPVQTAAQAQGSAMRLRSRAEPADEVLLPPPDTAAEVEAGAHAEAAAVAPQQAVIAAEVEMAME